VRDVDGFPWVRLTGYSVPTELAHLIDVGANLSLSTGPKTSANGESGRMQRKRGTSGRWSVEGYWPPVPAGTMPIRHRFDAEAA
jgi:hypothetical protein